MKLDLVLSDEVITDPTEISDDFGLVLVAPNNIEWPSEGFFDTTASAGRYSAGEYSEPGIETSSTFEQLIEQYSTFDERHKLIFFKSGIIQLGLSTHRHGILGVEPFTFAGTTEDPKLLFPGLGENVDAPRIRQDQIEWLASAITAETGYAPSYSDFEGDLLLEQRLGPDLRLVVEISQDGVLEAVMVTDESDIHPLNADSVIGVYTATISWRFRQQ